MESDRDGNCEEVTEKGKNMSWTIEMDNLLLDTLVEQANKGFKVDKSFKKPAYTTTVKVMNENFSIDCNVGHIRN